MIARAGDIVEGVGERGADGADEVRATCGRIATEVVSCAHCGLVVPPGLVEVGADRQFCCHGCRTVHALIGASGLGGYYRVRDATDDGVSRPARSTGRDYAECDDPAYAAAFVRTLADGSMQTTFLVEGVHCAACVWLIERLGRTVPGVMESRLDFQRGTATVRWDPTQVRLSAVARGLDRLGYPAHPPRGQTRAALRRREDRRTLARVGVAGFLAGNVMLLAFALYGGLFSEMDALFRQTFRWLSAALGLVSLAWPGRVFFASAWSSVRARSVNLDVPIALALALGGAAGLWNTVRGSGEIYFESLSMLVFLLLVGRWIQHGQQRRAASAVELLFTLTPTRARVVESDSHGGRTSRTVPIEAIATGDLIEVLAGDSVPADGVVVDGRSSVDASLLTGESAPVGVGPGDSVSAGTVNVSAALVVRVEASGESARVARLMALVAEGASRRAPVVQLADRTASWFVVGVIALAAVTAAVWAFIDPSEALDHTTALLIVSCPCALALATPLVLTSSIGRLAKRGVLVKGGDALERLAHPGRLVLDKTGTVTEGGLRVLEYVGDAAVLGRVLRLEATSGHPVARAIVRWGEQAGVEISAAAPSGVEQTTGAGLTGWFGEDSPRVTLSIGTQRYVREAARGEHAGGVLTPELEAAVGRGAAASASPVFVACDGVVVGVFLIGDRVRNDAVASVGALREGGWRVSLASGDRSSVAVAVGSAVGVGDVTGEMSPEDKLGMVRTLVAERDARGTSESVVMVGDGVNDAAALAAADVGIAVHGGAEASLEAADVAIQRPGLAPVLDLMRESRRAMGRIRVCLGVSVAYNVAGVTLAVLGLVNPLLAAVLMPLSSLTVLTIATASAGRKGGM
jgi:Cu2+-exporting ATPase